MGHSNNGRRRLEEAGGRRPQQGSPQVDILEIEEHTYPSFSMTVSDPMPGTRMLTMQIVDAPNRKVIKHCFPLDTAPAQDLGHKLAAPAVEVASEMPPSSPSQN